MFDAFSPFKDEPRKVNQFTKKLKEESEVNQSTPNEDASKKLQKN
jgi:hypothetical protein